MNQKEYIKNLMSSLLKNAQQVDLKDLLKAPNPKSNFLVIDTLISKLKKDLSTFTAAKDTELFVQDLTNSLNFIKYLYENKVSLNGIQLVLDHNATGAYKFIDLEYSQLSKEQKSLYVPFPEKDQEYWVYKDGVSKFLQDKMKEAEESLDPGFKNILKTLLSKLTTEIHALSPSLIEIPPEDKKQINELLDIIPVSLSNIPDFKGTVSLYIKDIESSDSLIHFFKINNITVTINDVKQAATIDPLFAARILQQRAKFKKDRSHLDKLTPDDINLAEIYLQKISKIIEELSSKHIPQTKKIEPGSKTPLEAIFAKMCDDPNTLPLSKESISLSRINKFAKAYLEALGSNDISDSDQARKLDGAKTNINNIRSIIAILDVQFPNFPDTLLLTQPPPLRNIGTGPQPNPFRNDIASFLHLDGSSSNPLPAFKTTYISFLDKMTQLVTYTLYLIDHVMRTYPALITPALKGQTAIGSYNIADIKELKDRAVL